MRLRNQSIGFSPKLLFVSLSALAFIFIMAVSAVWIWLMLFRSPPFDSHIKIMLYSSCTKRSVVNIYSGSILVIQDYFIPQMLPINSHLSRSWTTQDAEKQAQERAGSQLSRHGYGGASFITQAALRRYLNPPIARDYRTGSEQHGHSKYRKLWHKAM